MPTAPLSAAAAKLFAFYVQRASETAGEGLLSWQVLKISAADVAAATGIDATRIGRLRRELLEAGLVIIGRPRGLTPEVAVRVWNFSPEGPAPLGQRIEGVLQGLTDVAWDLASLVRIKAELGREEEAGDLAEALSLVRRAVACHTLAEDRGGAE